MGTFQLSLSLSTHSSYSYLVELEFKSQDVAKCERFTHVRLDERQEELILVRSTLINLQDYVQNTIWVQVKTSFTKKKSRQLSQKGFYEQKIRANTRQEQIQFVQKSQSTKARQSVSQVRRCKRLAGCLWGQTLWFTAAWPRRSTV